MDFHIQPCINAQPKEKITLLHISLWFAKLVQKSEMRKDIVIELSYKGFG